MKTSNVKRTLEAVPPIAWIAAAAGVVALYLVKRASDAAGKGVDAVVDFLKPKPKIENVSEISYDYRGATYFVRRDGYGPFQFSVTSDAPVRRNWLLVMDGESVEGGSIDYQPGDGRKLLTEFPKLASSRYEFFVADADGRDPVRIFDFTGKINLGAS